MAEAAAVLIAEIEAALADGRMVKLDVVRAELVAGALEGFGDVLDPALAELYDACLRTLRLAGLRE